MPLYWYKWQDGIKHKMKYMYFRDKDDEANLRCCPQAQTLRQSSLQSAPSSIYLCADTLAWWNHRIQRWFLHQHSCQLARVVYSKTVLAFIFYILRRPGISHLWRVTRARPQRCHLQNHSLRRFWYRMCACTYEIFGMILISLLTDRNHAEDRLNVPANVPGRHDRNFNRFTIRDKRFLQGILSSLYGHNFISVVGCSISGFP